MGSHFPQTPKIGPPKVSVIKSTQQVVSSNRSNEALDGDTSKRTGLVDTQRVVETFEMIANSPVVHRALGGRKMVRNQRVNESAYTTSVHWQSNIGSPRNEQQKPPGISTDRSKRMTAPKPAPHVGPLQVPESLRAQHLGLDSVVEQMAAGGGAKRGAVGTMIDRIYSKDRRMVNNMYKGNMLSTAVLTDMSRYHKLRSQTGVENKNYDDLWLQERIQEEKADIGLSLDCAPQAQ